MTIVKNILFLVAVVSFLAPLDTNATINMTTEYKNKSLKDSKFNESHHATLADVIVQVITFILNFLAALAVVVIVVAGIIYITSGGDEGKTESAKRWILYAIIGLVIALLGWVIINIVSNAIAG